MRESISTRWASLPADSERSSSSIRELVAIALYERVTIKNSSPVQWNTRYCGAFFRVTPVNN